MTPRLVHPLLAVLAGTGIVAAQATHLVGPGGFAQIRDALAIAAPGDRIDVQPGVYAHFTAAVGVTIRAQLPGTVWIEYFAQLAPPGCSSNPTCLAAEGPTRIAPPVGQAVHCIGLVFRPTTVPIGFLGLRHRVVVSSGTATFTDCTLQSDGLDTLQVDNARVHLQGCTLACLGTGLPGCALAATTANVTAVATTFAGSPSASLPGPAVRLRSAELQGSQLQLSGGSQLFGGPHGAALDLDATSTAWLADTTLQSGGGGCAVVGAGSGRLARSTWPVVPGCAILPTGPLVGIAATTPLQSGAPFAVALRAEPNQIVALFASSDLGHTALPGLTDQPVTLDLAHTWFTGAVLANASGLASVQWNVPPGVGGLTLFVLGAGLQPATLTVSPSLGGVVR